MFNEVMKNWGDYKPSKTVWLWSGVAAAALTMGVGFTAGGWVTGATSSERIDTSTEQAVAKLAANICANRFLAATDANIKLAALKETDSWKQSTFIEEGGWVTFTNMPVPVNGAAQLCANQLVAAELPVMDSQT